LTIKFNITCCSCTRSHWMRGNSLANINDAMRVELAELRISNCELRAANAELRDQSTAGRITESACAAVTRQPREQMRAPAHAFAYPWLRSTQQASFVALPRRSARCTRVA